MITIYHDLPKTASPESQSEDSTDTVSGTGVSNGSGTNRYLRRRKGSRNIFQQSSSQPHTKRSAGYGTPLARKSGLLIDILGSGSGDPFSTLPYIARSDTSSLVYHWNTVFVHKTTPPEPRRKWFPLALQNPTLFHALMVISAADMFGSARLSPSAGFFRHRGEVIRLVRKNIQHAQTATSDGTIGAIACLIVTDSLSGHPERTGAHLAGIQQLISARGGVSKLDPLIQRIVGWVDLLASVSLSQRPILHQPYLVHPNYYSYYGTPSSSTTAFGVAFSARLLNFTGFKDLSDLAARTFWGLRNLSLLKETVNITDDLVKERISYSDRVELLERETQQLLHSSIPESFQTSNLEKFRPNLIFTLFTHATIIYICNTFRDVPPNALTATLAQRLEISMDMSDPSLNILLGTFPELMLWILFLGGGAAWGKSKVWFAKSAARILRMKKVDEMGDIAAAAESFLWPEGRENYDDSTVDEIEMGDFSLASSDSMTTDVTHGYDYV